MKLKEVLRNYSNDEVLHAARREYLVFGKDASSLNHLMDSIRNAPNDTDECRKEFMILAYFYEYKDCVKIGSCAGYCMKNGRTYRLTYRNTRRLEDFSGWELNTSEDALDAGSDEMLHKISTVLLSLNAFSDTVIKHYFDGDPQKANAAEYLAILREERKEKLDIVRARFEPHL